MALQLSRKQKTAFDLLDDPQVVELLFGGAAGGGKSLLVTLWAVLQCRQFPGITIGLGRKELTTLRKTTAKTILSETHPLLGVKQEEFRYSPLIDPGVYYINGSSIVFIDLAPAPSDPDFDRLGSLNLTHNIIEEAGEVDHKARSVFTSRKNRSKNAEYGITGKTILTCNPSQNFVRDEFYEPYLVLGADDFQKWPHGMVEINGQLIEAYRAFVKSLPTDNPFLSQNYMQTLLELPDTERRRLLEGDWEYDDDDAKLFKTYLFQTTTQPEGDEVYAGCDPARTGGDKTVFGLIRGNTVSDLVNVDIPRTPNFDIGGFVAEKFIEYCGQQGVGYDNSAVDAIGIGASVIDACNRLGFRVRAFNAGSPKGVRQLSRFGQVQEVKTVDGLPLFNNIRSQCYYDMAQAAHKGELRFIESLPYYHDLKRDLSSHQYEVKERQIIVEAKDRLKERLGRSPDFSDALMAAWWVKEVNKPAGILSFYKAQVAAANGPITNAA